MAAGQPRPLPPPPRLQTYPFQDLKDLHREEDRLLNTYEWVNKSAGTVRIPIGRAIDLMAERGLPYRQGGADAAAAPSPSGPESGAGPRSPGGAAPARAPAANTPKP
jgi:hypothetical protein